ncbi:putative ribonuclease H-like domain-containing protein [Tanacetum coccineum]
MSAKGQSGLGAFDTQTVILTLVRPNSSVETFESVPEPVVVEPKVVSQPKVWFDAPIIEEYDFSHLIKDCDFHEKRMAKRVKLNKKKAVLTRTSRIPVYTARQNLSSQTATTSTAKKFNTARPIVNEIRLRNNFYKSHSPIRIPFNRTTAPRTNFSNHKVSTVVVKAVSAVEGIRETAVKPSADLLGRPKPKMAWVPKRNKSLLFDMQDNPQRALKNKGIIDSRCSRNMTGNKAYLAEYQDYNGGPVAFWRQHKDPNSRTGDIIEFCGSKGIKREYSNARTPQQNRVAERKNRTLIEAARTMLADSFLPNTFWAEAVSTACYVLNRPVRSENQANKTAGPEEANHSECTQIILMQEFSKWKMTLQVFFVCQLCSFLYSLIKSSEAKNEGEKPNKDIGLKTNEEPEANGVAEDLRKEFAEEAEDLLLQAGVARATSTNTVNTVRTPIGTASPSIVFSAGGPALNNNDQDDSQIPALEDIYDNPNDGIFTNASYDDEGAVADFTNLESTVNEELLQFKIQKVWILVDLPYKKKAIGTKWVYRNKKDERGVVVRNKARLVAQGYRQEEGIDYDEVVAHVDTIEAIRIFLAFASYMGFIVYQIDVKSAFLYGTIDEEVYVSQPPGFVDPKFPKKVYKVVKALYGLHQALRAWYATLSTFLLKSGYKRGTINKTLFIKKDKNDIMLVQVKQKEDGIFISQDKYVAEILKKFDFMSVKTACTPIETHKPLVKVEEATDVDVHLYRSMIGSLMYLTASRPDIMFDVCACSRFQVTPKTSHLHAVKRIFRYLKGKPKLGLWYPIESSFDLVAYSDSDYGGANLDRKSIIGGFQFLSHRLILWQCKKQTIVATSTTEAEYVVAANCYRQNLVFHSKTKHIKIRHHFIRDAYEKKLIQVLKIHTDDNVVDLLTKAFNMLNLRRGNCWKLGCSLSVGFYHHTTNGHQFTMSNKHQELASPEQTASGKDFSNPLIVDSLLKTTWFINCPCYCNEALAIPGQTTTGKESSNPLMADSLPKTIQSNDPPLSRGYTLGSREDSLELMELMAYSALCTMEDGVQGISATIDRKVKVLVSEASIRRHLKLEDSEGLSSLLNAEIFEQLANMGTYYCYHMPWNQYGFSTIYTSLIQQFWETTALCTMEDEVQGISATIDRKVKVLVSEASIRRHLKLEDSEGLSSLLNAETFEQLANLGYVYSLGRDKGSLSLNEWTVLYTSLSKKVASLESELKQTKETYSTALTKLILRVKKGSFQSREDAYTDITLVTPTKVSSQSDQSEDHLRVLSAAKVLAEAAKQGRGVGLTQTYTRRRRNVGTGSGGVSTASESDSTAGGKAKDKGKEIMQEPEPPKKLKKRVQVQMSMDEEIAKKMFEEEQAKVMTEQEQERMNLEAALELQRKLDAREEVPAEATQATQEHEIDWNDPSVLRYHAQLNRPYSVAEVRKNMIMYLKNQGGYKMSYFKGMKYEDIRPIFEQVWDQTQSFMPMDSEKESKEKAKERMKRKTSKAREDKIKRQKTKDDPKKLTLMEYVQVVSDSKEAINVIPLAVKSPIVSWKSYCKGDMRFYEIHRADGNYKTYKFFSEMLNDFDRDDLIMLYRLFNEKYASTRPGFDDLMLWGDMKIMFDPDENGKIWKNHNSQELIEW